MLRSNLQFLTRLFRQLSPTRPRHRRRTTTNSTTALVNADVLEDRVLLAAQVIGTSNASAQATPGAEYQFGVTYNVTPGTPATTTNGLNLRLHFNSAEVQFNRLENVQNPQSSLLSSPPYTVQAETATTDDNNSATDQFVIVQWSTNAQPVFSPDSTMPLFNAVFTPLAGFSGNTSFNFARSGIPFGSDGQLSTFSATPLTVPVAAAANNTPVITSSGTASVAENQTSAYTVTATDADAGDTLTYAISGGADAALFNIAASTGVVTFATAPDFEVPADAGGNNVYNIQVTANDGTVNSAVQNVAITVTDVNEVTPNRAPVITSGATASVAENQTSAYTVTATDADAGDTLTYAISGGADAALFNIAAATGVVTFATAPDFETPGSAAATNVYNIQVTANDGTTNSAALNVAITVTDVNEVIPNRAPVITSAATASVAENQTSAYTVTATDADVGDTLTYAISGGADAALFNIAASTGVVTFATAPDFEVPADSSGNNVYNIQVAANDGTVNSAVQNVAITVTDVNEVIPNRAPVITSGATASVAENQTSAYTVTATDADGNTLTYAISGGADAALFNIAAATGVVTFVVAPDFEVPADSGGNNVYNIQVTANDGTVNSAVQNVAITVTDVNDTPNQTTGTIQGRKFNDLDGDGVRDANENYLNGWTIQLVNSAGTVVASQVTANRGSETGWYSFDAAPGTYTLQEVAQEGFRQTAPVDGLAALAANLDSSLNLQETGNAFPNWGGLNERWMQSNSGWHFITPDGTLREWDNSPAANLTGAVVASLSSAYHGDTTLLSSAADVLTPVYTVVAGQTLSDVNFGGFDTTQSASIQGRIWNDLDGDGQRDSDEPWANGWTVELVEGPGSISQTTATADLDLNNDGQIDPETETGWYQFNDVSAGDWIVRQENRIGWSPTVPGGTSNLEAFELNVEKDFRFNRSLYANWGGLNEHWIDAADGWHYITPNGQLFKWNGSGKTALSGDLVAELSSDIHADPSLLYNARNPREAAVQVSAGESAQDVNFGNRQESDTGGSGSSNFAGVGNVRLFVFGDNLILRGDDGGNGLRVYTNDDGFVTVAGIGGTTIEGQSEPWVLTGWTSIPGSVLANLRGGDDAVVVEDIQIGDHLNINTHGGNDYLLIEDINVGRNFDIRSNWGDNTVVIGSSSFGNLARVITGRGNDVLRADNVRVGGRTVVRSWQGNDDFVAANSTFAGAFSVNSGSGNDEILLLDGNTFESSVTIDGRAGRDAVGMEGSSNFSSQATVRRVEHDSIVDPDILVDSLMRRLADVGLDGLLASSMD